MDRGGGLPPLPFLENRVEIEDHLGFEWDAYNDLRRDRPVGMMDLGAIPWTSFDRYAARHGIDEPDTFERFCRLMALIDDAERDYVFEKNKKK